MHFLTVGHGTLEAGAFSELLLSAGVRELFDIRTIPKSRRHPHFSDVAMISWLPEAGIAYLPEPALGGFRRPRPDSRNTALRNLAFRGYADYMQTPEFRAALDRVDAAAARASIAVMCSESLWWHCHRRLVADTATLIDGGEVAHLMHDGKLVPHRPTDGARPDGPWVTYDGGAVSWVETDE